MVAPGRSNRDHNAGSHVDRSGTFNISIGSNGHERFGLIHLGRDRGDFEGYAAIVRRPGLLDGRRGRGHGYGPHHYYRHYTPFYDPYGSYDYPCLGYRYASVYYDAPIVYRTYDEYALDEYGPPYVGATTVREYANTAAPLDPSLVGPPAQGVAAQAGADYEVIPAPMDVSIVEQGNLAFARGHYEEASRRYIQAIMVDERDAYAKLLYAVANFAMAEYDVAAVSLRRALVTNELLIDRPVDLRTLYDSPARFDVQLAELAGYVDAHARDDSARLMLAYFQYATGEPELASAVLGETPNDSYGDTLAARLKEAIMAAARADRRP